jgi:hypothetical protein
MFQIVNFMTNKSTWAIMSLILLAFGGTLARAGQAHGQRQGKPTKSVLELRLNASAHPTQFVQIYGSGALWEKTIGLGLSEGIEIHDKKLIASLLQTLRGSGQTKDWDLSFTGGVITINFMKVKPDGMFDYIDAVNYIRRNSSASCLYRVDDDPTDTMAALRSGYGLKFEAFVRQMVKRARLHNHSVSFFEVHGD